MTAGTKPGAEQTVWPFEWSYPVPAADQGLPPDPTTARTPEIPLVPLFRFRLARRFTGPAASLAIAALMTPPSSAAARQAPGVSEPARRSSGASRQVADGAALLQPDGGPDAVRS